MNINRIVPDIESSDLEGTREFYAGFLGMDIAMDQGWVATFASPSNPKVQITVVEAGCTDYPQPDISVEVEDVDHAYSEAKRRHVPIEYPLTVEDWGVTRFFVRDPNGKLVNILSHTSAEQSAR